MKHRNLKMVGLALVGSLVMAAGAAAAPTGDSTVSIVGQGPLYKEVKRPVDISFGAAITPAPGDATLNPLISANYSLPSDVAFVPDPKMKVCTAINEGNANFPPETAISLCPTSVIGDGVAQLYLAQLTSALITDPVVTIFNGGKDSNGSGVLSIHAYSASTNAGIYMSGSIKNGELNVAIPRLTADSSVPTFTLNIPGTIGQDPGYAEASCTTGTYTTSAVFTLGKRASDGTISDQSTLPTAPKNQSCTGLAGTARINRVSVSGPSKAKRGRTVAYKVRVSNNGQATANGVRIRVSGRGLRLNTPIGRVSPGVTRTIRLNFRFTRPGKVTAKIQATSSNAGSRTIRKVVRVRK